MYITKDTLEMCGQLFERLREKLGSDIAVTLPDVTEGSIMWGLRNSSWRRTYVWIIIDRNGMLVAVSTPPYAGYEYDRYTDGLTTGNFDAVFGVVATLLSESESQAPLKLFAMRRASGKFP